MAGQADPKIALDIFVEKLGAFRSTLTAQERELLDQIVAGVSVDVSAHAVEPSYAVHFAVVNAAAADSAISLASAAAMEQAAIDSKDVVAHAADAKLESTWAFKVAADGAYAVEAIPSDAAISNERLSDV